MLNRCLRNKLSNVSRAGINELEGSSKLLAEVSHPIVVVNPIFGIGRSLHPLAKPLDFESGIVDY